MWLKRKCLKFFVRSSNWQNFEFCNHFGGKIGNGDDFLQKQDPPAALNWQKIVANANFASKMFVKLKILPKILPYKKI